MIERLRRITRTAARLGIVAFVAIACQPSTQTPAPRSRSSAAPHVLVFSDLHFNPFADPAVVDSLARADVARWPAILSSSKQQAFSQYGSDTNYPLMTSALAAMRSAEPTPEVILFAGDFLAHNFQFAYRKVAHDTSAGALAAFTAKTNQFIVQQVAAAFPGVQVLPALGNNDSSCGDYMSEPGSGFLRAFAESWRPLVSPRGSPVDFVGSFSRAGHFSAYVPSIGIRVIVMNDVYWSPRYSNACGSLADNPGRDALGWLEQTLMFSRQRNEEVWLLMHVPVGMDVYATLRTDTLVSMIDPKYATPLISLLRRYGSTVRFVIAGHTHMNEFRVISDVDGTPLLGSQQIPSVSTNVGTNPAFAVMSVDSASGNITDYTVHSLTNLASASTTTPGRWSKEYDFREVFGLDGLSSTTLATMQAALQADTTLRARYINFFDSGSARANVSSSWRAYWCGIDMIDRVAFDRCYRRP